MKAILTNIFSIFYTKLINLITNICLSVEKNLIHNLIDIIPMELKECQERYKSNQNIIDEMNRRKISSAIIEYFNKHSIPLTLKNIEQVAEQIVKYFPTESKLSWFDRRAGKRKSLLFAKPKAKKQKGRNSYDSEEVPIECELGDLKNEDKSQYYERIQKSLKDEKFKNWNDVINIWANTQDFRKCHGN